MRFGRKEDIVLIFAKDSMIYKLISMYMTFLAFTFSFESIFLNKNEGKNARGKRGKRSQTLATKRHTGASFHLHLR